MLAGLCFSGILLLTYRILYDHGNDNYNGSDIFFCFLIFSPTPDVKFTRVGKQMPYPKYHSEKSDTVMKIKDIQEADNGTYKCTGQNTQGEKEHEFRVDVQSELLTEGR